MARVLVVEDNPDMRQTLTEYLKGKGFEVRAVDSTEDGIDEVDEHDFDVGLIDIGLPGKSGFDMIEYIREQDNSMPLIALTARSDIDDKLQGFALGATDYVIKPFDLQELLARIKAHLQRSGPSNDTADIQTVSFALSPSRHVFSIRNQEVGLTNTEFRILHLLLMHQGAVVTNTDLIEYVWDESHVLESPPIRIHIANIRRKIGDTDFKIVRTIPGMGYKIVDPAESHHAA